jgi:hypothetical protein
LRSVLQVTFSIAFVVIGASLLRALQVHGASLPHIQLQNGAGELVVNGRPFLILGGELGNSSAETAARPTTRCTPTVRDGPSASAHSPPTASPCRRVATRSQA